MLSPASPLNRMVALLIAAGLLASSCGEETSPQSTQPIATLAAVSVPPPTSTAEPSPNHTIAPIAASVVATVVSVTDGDTVRVRLPHGVLDNVRLIGIDAPDDSSLLATEATTYLEQLVLGKEVRLVTDVSDRDRDDRLLRFVFVGDLLANEEMVRAGMAIATAYFPDTLMTRLLEKAQYDAKMEGVGRWAITETTGVTTANIAKAATESTTTPVGVNAAADLCHPSYAGACVPSAVSDVDCSGGSGNGPYYVGRVTVVGPDEYDLDTDGDGIGCESS